MMPWFNKTARAKKWFVRHSFRNTDPEVHDRLAVLDVCLSPDDSDVWVWSKSPLGKMLIAYFLKRVV